MILPGLDCSAKPDVAKAVEAVIAAAMQLVAVVPGSFAERETALLAALQEGGRVALERDLQRMETALPAEVLIGNERRVYREHQDGSDVYPSLFGDLHVRRRSFREVGVRNGPTVIALELMAGLIEGATPAFAHNIAEGYGLHDIRKHLKVLASSHRHTPPRATLERLAQRLSGSISQQIPAIEPLVRASEVLPAAACGVVVGLDRTSAPMAEPRPERAPKKPRRRRRKPRVRATPAPIDVNYRMAYVGTVTVVDEHGESLEVRRYAWPASCPPETLCARMAADVEVALKQREMPVLVMQDAAPEMWNLVRDALRPLRRPDCIVLCLEAIDLMHALGHLSDALIALGDDEATRQRQLTGWHAQLLARDSAIEDIENELLLRLPTTSGAERSALEDELTFLRNNKDRIRYARLARRGLPLGSGVTESAAKTVINQRAKGAGQRWKEPGLRHALAVRSIVQSERLPAFWGHFSRLYAANVTCAPTRRRDAA